MRTLLTLTLIALALPAAAAAGGYATAGLGPPPPGIEPGDTWPAEITIKAHGITPAEGLAPTLTIRGPETKTFSAKPTGKPGVYVAEVVFPTAGSYRYEVMDGYAGQVHTFAPVEIGTLPVPGGSGFPAWAIAPIVVGGAMAAALAALLLRRRAPRPATALH
jgi:hypothetical protein